MTELAELASKAAEDKGRPHTGPDWPAGEVRIWPARNAQLGVAGGPHARLVSSPARQLASPAS